MSQIAGIKFVAASSVFAVALAGLAAVGRAQSASPHPKGHGEMKSGHMMPSDDGSYVEMMQMHHQMGIDMAKMAQEKAQREDVKAFAKKTIDEQTKDIEELLRIQQSMKTGTAGHESHGSMMKEESEKMMGDLSQAQGAAFDQKFIETMIPHHQQAIDMSTPLTKFKAEDVQAFARKTIESQRKELKELNELRSKR